MFKYNFYERFGLRQLILKEGVNDEVLQEIKRGEYNALWLYSGDFSPLSELVGYLKDLSVLRFHSDVRQDVSWINKLNGLAHLTIKGNVKGLVNFSNFDNLSSAELECSDVTESALFDARFLKSLLLSKCKIPLSEFGDIVETLQTLNLTSGRFESLEGIHRFNKLKSLVLMDIRSLRDISELKICQNLEKLDITCCNNVQDLEVVGGLSNLRDFTFENKSISSLSWLPRECLEFISLGPSTVVEDRDVSILTKFPVLKKAIFTKKKGYQYSALQLQPFLQGNK